MRQLYGVKTWAKKKFGNDKKNITKKKEIK
jgi:hypothetical protein